MGVFDYIQPSPRIQYQWLDAQQLPLGEWLEFRPRPPHLTFGAMLRRLLWNARWNETLFMMSCAERIAEHYTVHSENQILERITRDGAAQGPTAAHALHFRLVFVHRQQQQRIEAVRFTSRSLPLPERGA